MNQVDMTPKFLFLDGAYLHDCKECPAASIAIETNSAADVPRSYQPLPRCFTSIEAWPKQTNLACWHCTLHFDTVPVFVPRWIEPRLTKDGGCSMAVDHCFCSFHCATAYIHERPDWNNRIENINRLRFLYYVMNGRLPASIEAAPSRAVLKRYGGDVSEAQYREMLKALRVE